MMRRLILLFLFVPFFTSMGNSQSAWYAELLEHRKKRDEELRTEEKSPIPTDYKEQFNGLRYFEPDNSYSVTAEFIRIKKPKPVWFATSDGKEKEYMRFAQIKFMLLGKQYILTAYYSEKIRAQEGMSKHIFVPFKDLTNLIETYGGGRYLDLTEPEDNILQVDFNRAYNPYCAYSDGYSCPKVPNENYLEVKIPVGEKNLYTDK